MLKVFLINEFFKFASLFAFIAGCLLATVGALIAIAFYPIVFVWNLKAFLRDN